MVMRPLNIIVEPYLNDKKPRLEPNYSFDLCRLACSLYDNLVDDDDDEDEEQKKGKKNKISRMNYITHVKQIIEKWCTDDKGRNILYKKNGDERYPDFKLYKMIARTVHNHTPQSVIEHIFFESYVVGKKKIKKPHQILNIDELPCYE